MRGGVLKICQIFICTYCLIGIRYSEELRRACSRRYTETDKGGVYTKGAFTPGGVYTKGTFILERFHLKT